MSKKTRDNFGSKVLLDGALVSNVPLIIKPSCIYCSFIVCTYVDTKSLLETVWRTQKKRGRRNCLRRGTTGL